MKLYSVGGVVGGLLVEVYQVACYGIGRRAVSLLTGSQVRTEEEDEGLAFAWYGVARGRDGKLVLSESLAGIVGFTVLVIAAVVVVWVLNVARQPGA